VYKFPRTLLAIFFALAIVATASAQSKNFIPVEGAGLRAKIDNAIAQGNDGLAGGGRCGGRSLVRGFHL